MDSDKLILIKGLDKMRGKVTDVGATMDDIECRSAIKMMMMGRSFTQLSRSYSYISVLLIIIS